MQNEQEGGGGGRGCEDGGKWIELYKNNNNIETKKIEPMKQQQQDKK